MKPIVAAKRTELLNYAVREFLHVAKNLEDNGEEILYLNIGDPLQFDFNTPAHLHEQVHNTRHLSQCYGDSMGLKSARVAIAEYANKKGIKNVTENNVMITTGATEAISISLASLINPNDNILVPLPNYPVYQAYINFFDGKVNGYYMDEQNNWELDVDEIRKRVNEKTKAIVIINPNNPTGAVYSKKVLKQVLDVAAEHNLLVMSDEVYDRILFDDVEHHSMASLADDVPIITFGSLSKNYLSPGWRIGWMVHSGPEKQMENYVSAMKRIALARLCAPHPHQHAIEKALNGPQDHIVEMNSEKLLPRRDLIYKRLNEIDGISCTKPQGAFYAFPKISIGVDSDEKFVLDLLKQEKVFTVHGSGFGQEPNTMHFRMVFLPQMNVLKDAMDRIERFVKKNYIQ